MSEEVVYDFFMVFLGGVLRFVCLGMVFFWASLFFGCFFRFFGMGDVFRQYGGFYDCFFCLGWLFVRLIDI